jgi:hypothetical protein
LYLAAVEELASRRIVGFGLSEHHDAELAAAALKMAVAVRGGAVARTMFHSDRGGEYSAERSPGLPTLWDQPVDGSRRIVLRQRRGGVVLLDVGVGAVPSHPAGDQARRPAGDRQVHRLVQPDPPTQHLRHEVTDRVRGDAHPLGQRALPTPGSYLLRRGEHPEVSALAPVPGQIDFYDDTRLIQPAADAIADHVQSTIS